MNEERASAAQGEDTPGSNPSRDSGTNDPQDALGDRKEAKERKVDNPRELDDARYAALDCRAHSDQARALVASMTDWVAAHELAAGTRTNRRKKKQTALSSAVERLLADLLQAQASEK